MRPLFRRLALGLALFAACAVPAFATDTYKHVGTPIVTAENVTTYGATLGASQSSAVRLANTLALRRAVAASTASGYPVVIPGTLECEVPMSGASQVLFGTYSVGVTLPTNAAIQGLGVNLSKISWFPDNTDLVIFFWLDARSAQRKATLSDFELAAPPTVVASTFHTYSLYHSGAPASSYADSLRFERMLFTGGASSLFASQDGNGTTEIIGTTFNGGYVGIGYYGSDLPKFFIAKNSTFKGSADHAVYIHPSISFSVEGSEFNTAGYYCWHNYGVSPTLAPQYQIFRGNHVSSTCTRGIITGKLGEVLIEGNVLENGEITMYGDARIIGNRIAGSVQIAGGHANHKRAYISGNRIVCSTIAAFQKAIAMEYANSEYDISHNYFEVTTQGGNGIIAVNVATGRANIEGNWFTGAGTENTVCVTSGSARIHRNTFGSSANSSVIVQSSAVVDTDISENKFLSAVDGKSIHTFQLNDGVLRGHDNEYAATNPFNVETPGGHTYQRLRGSERVSPNAIASAASITLPINYGIFHVTGTTTIDTILRAGAVDVTRLHEGAITLIFDSTAATSAAGNILPKTTGARTANTAYRFVFDPNANKWIES